ncbi:MAG: glycosyl transferase, partial [Chloroflexi bacterium]|nr:glycosyl transferase [Chloroflexota bacterium]
LGNAIAHDIAAEGSATAELLDAEYDSHDATDAGKLLLMASLANVPNAVRGLAIPEIITHLAEPGRDAARLKNEVLPALATQAWYMHSTRDGKLYVRDVQNLNARLETLVKAYVDEQALKELRERLEGLFRPEVRDVYQRVQVFPAIDAIEPEQDRVTLVIARPSAGGLDPDVIKFYEQATWKNRLAFLSGPRNTYNDLVNIGKRLRAVGQIVKELTEERTPESDPQMIQAEQLRDRHTQNFHSAVRETFTTLWYPTGEALASSDFHMRFGSNRYDGEEQVRSLLGEKMKFTDDVSGETFRKKCEQRLFTQQAMPWVEVKRRAATNTGWQWHIPSALEDLKTECLFRDVWREENGYVDKGPFERPKTDVSVRELTRDDTTGKVLLRLTPVHGDTLYWEVGSGASTASARLEGSELRSSALRLSFLCVDSTGEHETGEPVTWQNRITLKHRIFQAGDERMMELEAAPMAHVHYTTDGSDPKLAGARYADPFALPQSATVVLAYAERDGVASEVLNVPVERPGSGPGPQVHVDPRLPARLERRQETHSTQDTYAWIEKQEKHRGRPAGLTVTSGGSGRATEWAQLVTSEKVSLSTEQLVEALGLLRRVQGEGQVMMEVQAVCYPTGQDLLDWVAAERTELQPGEVQQKS